MKASGTASGKRSLHLVKTMTFAALYFSVGFGVTYLLTGSIAIATGVAPSSRR